MKRGPCAITEHKRSCIASTEDTPHELDLIRARIKAAIADYMRAQRERGGRRREWKPGNE